MSPAELLAIRGEIIRELPKIITEQGIGASVNGKFKNAVYLRDAGYFGLLALDKPQNEESQLVTQGIKNTLLTTARHQGTKINPATEEQPGRFPHEIFYGPNTDQQHLAKIKANGGPVVETNGHLEMVTWWALDATPLWICLFTEYVTATQDEDLKGFLWPNFEAGLEWMRVFGDKDGDGLIEGSPSHKNSSKNQWWKDSENSLIDEDGNFPLIPIAPLDVNSFAFLAEIKSASLYESMGDHKKAKDLLGNAQKRKELINKKYWTEDLQIISPALDGAKRPVRIVTSDNVIALWAGVLEHEIALQVVRRNLEPDMLTPYGLRTRSRLSKQYNPLDYQNGNVWGHLALLAAAACEKMGFYEQSKQFEASLEKSIELNFVELTGVDDLGHPFPYLEQGKPAACAPHTFHLGAALNRTALDA